MAERPSRFRVAWTAGRLASRRLLRRKVGTADQVLGEELTAQLDQMKGLAMKVGQIISYMDVPLPEVVQDKLAALQKGQTGLAADEARAVIETSLGRPVEALFEDFDFTPVAAASIGQVHRARVEGEAVAVKVQYPDVARSFSDDLGSVRRLAALGSLASAIDAQAIVDELAARLTEECDYQREARMQRWFRSAFADDARVQIPEVVESRCAEHVLTTRWVEGQSFEAIRAHADPEVREQIAATLTRFSYRSLLELAVIQADPHPGNFLFVPGGPVVFLDFGCVRQLDTTFVEAVRQMIDALRDGDRTRFAESTRAMGMVGRPRKFDYDHFFVVMEHLYRPLLDPRFTWSPEYMREAMKHNGPTNPNARSLAMPPVYIWVARLQWGLWSILTRLGVRGALTEVLDEVLARPLRPMLDARGERAESSLSPSSSSTPEASG